MELAVGFTGETLWRESRLQLWMTVGSVAWLATEQSLKQLVEETKLRKHETRYRNEK